MTQQFTLPMSSIYDANSTDTQWDDMEIIDLPFMQGSYYDSETNAIYFARLNPDSDSILQLYIQNASTLEFTVEEYPKTDTLRSQTFRAFANTNGVFFAVQGRNETSYSSNGRRLTGYTKVYKFNRETKTVTLLFGTTTIAGSADNYSTQSPRYNSAVGNLVQIEDNKYVLPTVEFGGTSADSSGYITSNTAKAFLIQLDLTNQNATLIEVKSASVSSNTVKTHSFSNIIWMTQISGNYLYCVLPGLWKATTSDPPIFVRLNLATNTITQLSIPSTFSQLFTAPNLSTVQAENTLMYKTISLVVGAKTTGQIDLVNGTINPLEYPEVPSNYIGNFNALQYIGDKFLCYTSGSLATLNTVKNLPQEAPLVLMLFKGDKFNSFYKDIQISALVDPETNTEYQPAFSITRKLQTADQDYEVHLNQYELKQASTPITVIKS